MLDAVPDDLAQFASKYLSTPPSSWSVRDLSRSYQWLKSPALHWVIDSDTSDSVLAVRQADGKYYCLNCPSGLATISTLISRDLGPNPFQRLGAAKLAELLMEWYRDPRGYVLTPSFFERKKARLDGWLQGSAKDAQTLRQYCVEPRHEEPAGERWSLRFNVVNRLGGVELWTATGANAPYSIESIDIRSLAPSGTFSYPDEF